MNSGSIIHVNMIGLMAAVEERLDRSLRGRPFVVARPDVPRAVVLDLSPEAYRQGVRRGMLLEAARAVVRDVRICVPQPLLYEKADRMLQNVALGFTPLVERAGRGHLFLDVQGTGRLFGPPEDAARTLLGDIADQLGIVPTVALASTKTAAKVASRVFRPFGFAPLTVNDEYTLIARQPVELLPGVGVRLLPRLLALGIETIGTLASLAPDEALAISPRGWELVQRARGIDDSPVNPEPTEQRLIRGESLLEPDSADPVCLRWRTRELAAELGFRMRKEGLGTRGLSLRLSYADGLASTGQVKAGAGTVWVDDAQLAEVAAAALDTAWTRRVRVRMLTLELSRLVPAGPELDWCEPLQLQADPAVLALRKALRLQRLQTALDAVHDRYGLASLVPGIAVLFRKGSPALTGEDGGSKLRAVDPPLGGLTEQGLQGWHGLSEARGRKAV